MTNSQDHYPSRGEMKKISKSLGITFQKLENWFKYKRRREVFQGKMEFQVESSFRFNDSTFGKKKHVFSKDQNEYLLKEFFKEQNPKKRRREEMLK